MPEARVNGIRLYYDRRGCTRSERPEPYERTSVAEQGDDAAALLDALAATPAVVIGRSYEALIDEVLGAAAWASFPTGCSPPSTSPRCWSRHPSPRLSSAK